MDWYVGKGISTLYRTEFITTIDMTEHVYHMPYTANRQM